MDIVNMATEDALSVGKEFGTLGELKQVLSEYNSQCYTNFVISSSNKKSVLIQCKHARERKTESSGKRPKQHYNFLGCKASLRVYISQKDGTLKIAQSNLEHSNDEPSEAIFSYQNTTLNDEDKELVMTLKEANTKPSQIKRVLVERKNKNISTQRLRNLISKFLKQATNENQKSLQEFLLSMDEDGGIVQWTFDTDDSVDSLFLSSVAMKKKFDDCNPFVIQMDTTFNVEKGRYKLVAFCYLDSHPNKTEISAIALISNESESHFNFILSEFKKLNNLNDYIFLVDKDFNNIDCVQNIFELSMVLLCVFHLLKFMKNLVATATATVEMKGDMFDKFKSLVYCPSQALYGDRKQVFLNYIKDIQVRCDKTYVSFHHYFLKNWDSCAEMWVKFYRNSLPLLGDHTTNRIERQFWSLKLSISETFGSSPDTVDTIIHLINFTNERLSERRIFNATKSLVIYNADEFIRASQILSERGCIMFHKALKTLGERREKLLRMEEGGVKETFRDGNSKVYTTTTDACGCTFRKEHLTPCHHILLLRKDDEVLPMLDLDLFDYMYHRSRIDENTHPVTTQASGHYPREFGEEEQDVAVPSLTDREKYKAIMPILTNIGNLTACYPTKQFLEYIDQFKVIEDLIRKGKSLISDSVGNHPSVMQSNAFPDLMPSDVDNDISLNPTNQPSSTQDSSTEHSTIYSGNLSNNTSTQKNQENQPVASNDHPNAHRSSMYQLKFKQSLAQKGRPKKRSKQICFNRTAQDGTKAKKKKGNGKKRPHQEVLRNMQFNELSDAEVDLEQEEIRLPPRVVFTEHADNSIAPVPENINADSSSFDVSRAISYSLMEF